jgi:hypothetical protein
MDLSCGGDVAKKSWGVCASQSTSHPQTTSCRGFDTNSYYRPKEHSMAKYGVWERMVIAEQRRAKEEREDNLLLIVTLMLMGALLYFFGRYALLFIVGWEMKGWLIAYRLGRQIRRDDERRT